MSDASTTATGYLVNGTFALAAAAAAQGEQPVGAGSGYLPIGGSASPTTVLTYNTPVANEPVTVSLKQSIAASDPLRTGTYSKTLTFTLSTTQP